MSTANNQSPLGWNKALSVWWSFMWGAMVFGVLLGALLGGIAGGYVGATGHPEKGALYGAIAGWVATIPASMLALKQAISKHLVSLSELVK
jgi:hypothetical protein